MNIGPRGDGTIDPADVEILKGIGKWMSVNAESIKGTTRTPLPVQAWGESTLKGDTLYLHVFDWPKDGKLVVGGLKSKVANAYLLADVGRGALKLKAERVGDLDTCISVPAAAPDSVDSVIVLNCDSAVACDSTRLLSPAQENVLRSFDGELHGKLKFGPGKKTDVRTDRLTKLDESVSWKASVTQPTTFDVSASYDAAHEGGAYAVKVGEKSLPGAVKAGKLQLDSLGSIALDPGSYQIQVVAQKLSGEDLMNLRSVTLSPVSSGENVTAEMPRGVGRNAPRRRSEGMYSAFSASRRLHLINSDGKHKVMSRNQLIMVWLRQPAGHCARGDILVRSDGVARARRQVRLDFARDCVAVCSKPQKRLKYRPNLLVQGMQSGRTGVVGLMMPPSMHFHGQIARGIHDELIKNDYVPIQLLTNPSPEGKATEPGRFIDSSIGASMG